MKGDDYDPHEFRKVDAAITNFEAFVNVLKSSVGIGCLAMPMVYKNAGLLNGFLTIIVIGCTLLYAFHILMHGIYELCKRLHVSQLTYAKSIKYGILEGPPYLHFLSSCLGGSVDFFIYIYQFGVCCIYVVFVADTVKQIVDYYFIEIDSRLYMCTLVIPLMGIFIVRDLKHLAMYSALAVVLLFIGFSVILCYVLQDLPPISSRKAFKRFESYPLAIGTVMFAMESIGLMIAIEARMQNPKDYLGLWGILNRAMFIVLVLYSAFGFVGFWHYGDDVMGSITLNLPPNDILPQIVKVLFAVSIYISYALQGYVAVDILLNNYLINYVDMNKLTLEYIIRLAMVLATVLLAIGCPFLGLILSFFGALCLPILGIIFPILLDICLKYKIGYGPSKLYLWRDIYLIIFAMFSGAVGTYVATREIIEALNNPNLEGVQYSYK